jgi:membrane protein insertase Oxa1/YidC/SpoIIIJ
MSKNLYYLLVIISGLTGLRYFLDQSRESLYLFLAVLAATLLFKRIWMKKNEENIQTQPVLMSVANVIFIIVVLIPLLFGLILALGWSY